MKEIFTTVGTIGKPHGISGAFHFSLLYEPLRELKASAIFYIETPFGVLPFFIQQIELKDSRNGLLKFEEMNTREAIAPFVNTALMIKQKDFEQFFHPDKNDDFSLYEIIDENYGNLGKVSATTHNGAQIVVSVWLGQHEILLPLADAFVKKIDHPKKQLFLNLPEGMIEVYTQHNDERDED